MKKLLIILPILISLNSFSQYATKAYVDSLYKTLDSTVVKPSKLTTTNQTITLDTLTAPNNKIITYNVSLETNDDVATKLIQISNITGVYSVLSDKNIASLSRSFFSSVPKWTVTIQNNKVIIQATGVKNKIINWILKKTTL
jgi:hypothetical protein